MQHNKKNPAVEMFGVAPKPPSRGGHRADPKRIAAHFEDKEAIMRVFCKGCGRYSPITKAGAQSLASESGVSLPDLPAKSYFESEECVFCSDGFKDTKLKQV